MSYTRYKTVRYVKAKNIIKVRKDRKNVKQIVESEAVNDENTE